MTSLVAAVAGLPGLAGKKCEDVSRKRGGRESGQRPASDFNNPEKVSRTLSGAA